MMCHARPASRRDPGLARPSHVEGQSITLTVSKDVLLAEGAACCR